VFTLTSFLSSILHVLGKAGRRKSGWRNMFEKGFPRNLHPPLEITPIHYSTTAAINVYTITAFSILRALIYQFPLQKPTLFDIAVAKNELIQNRLLLKKKTI